MVHVNNPLPGNLQEEVAKAVKSLQSFLPHKRQSLDQKIIPKDVLEKACGIAVLTVVKGGFIVSGRIGSGIVIAKLTDGSWSAPCAIGTGGIGVGGQIGGELVETVMILNKPEAVKAFMHNGNVSLGANVSVAIGPTGRDAEASAMARNTAAIFSYSKTKGLFAGVSIEGTVIASRNDCNKKAYGVPVTAEEILSGKVQRPEFASVLYSTLMEGVSGDNSPGPSNNGSVPPPIPSRNSPQRTVIAIYDFSANGPDDLSFKKGDAIQVIKDSPSQNDWWRGKCNGKEGMFPANYVQ